MEKRRQLLAALKAAFPHTIPILAGFLFLGMTYGIFMNVSGFSWWYPFLMSLMIYAGSMQFVTVNLLLGAFSPLQALAMALMVNARHLFYGISLLEKYRDTGWKKPYLIYALTDETFSINCAIDAPEGVDKNWFMFFVSVLNQTYWVLGSTLGGIFGSLLTFNTEGLDFAMTAMFVVIFLENWLKEKNHLSALLGLGLAVLSLVAFGSDSFMIPAMIAIMLALTVMRPKLEQEATQ